MSGLCSYPRSRGRILPPHIAQALLEAGFLSDEDIGLYACHYVNMGVPEFLQAAHANADQQAGAVDASEVPLQEAPWVDWPKGVEEYDELHADQFDAELYAGAETLRSLLEKDSEFASLLTTFAGRVEVLRLRPGIKVYRVIGAVVPRDPKKWEEMKADPTNMISNPSGEFWTSRRLFEYTSEAQWRADFAVKTEWNGDHGYVVHTVKQTTFGFYGRAAAQSSALPGKDFPGGGMQLLVVRGTFDPTEGGLRSYSDIVRPFPCASAV